MKYVILIFIMCIIGCSSKDTPDTIVNPSDEFSECNEFSVQKCGGFNGEYCLFGFKWGDNETFSTTGVNGVGPKSPGGVVTFSFQEENGVVNTHRQVNIPSKSFDELIECSKTEIRRALTAWSDVANIDFEELEENSSSDIKFFVADVSTGGAGYPNYPEAPCNQIAGHVILNPNFEGASSCGQFYLYVLHEIGHALGLGHSIDGNVMGPGTGNSPLRELQQGDIKGMVQLYGEK